MVDPEARRMTKWGTPSSARQTSLEKEKKELQKGEALPKRQATGADNRVYWFAMLFQLAKWILFVILVKLAKIIRNTKQAKITKVTNNTIIMSSDGDPTGVLLANGGDQTGNTYSSWWFPKLAELLGMSSSGAWGSARSGRWPTIHLCRE